MGKPHSQWRSFYQSRCVARSSHGSTSSPLTQPKDDLRITYNDWPYGIDPKIVHLVVWVKFGFEEDMQTGDLTPAARRLIDDYVEKEFRSAVGKDHVSCVCRCSRGFSIDHSEGAVVQELVGAQVGACD